MKILALDQRSPDWLHWRKQGLGASDIPILLTGNHFGRTPLSLWQEKLGLIQREKASSWAMQRGIDNEPVARQWFEGVMDRAVVPMCCTHDEHEWMKASLDGLLIKDLAGESLLTQEAWNPLADWCQENPSKLWVCEIKVPNQDDHQDALDGNVPVKYQGQLLHQCLVSGARKAYYISYSLNNRRFSPEEQKTFVPFFPKEEDLEKLWRIEYAFWQCVLSATPPSAS